MNSIVVILLSEIKLKPTTKLEFTKVIIFWICTKANKKKVHKNYLNPHCVSLIPLLRKPSVAKGLP